MVKDEKLTYVAQEGKFQKFWALPYGNMNILLLGTGTSITQPAARLLAEEGVLMAFVGGGGTPLFMASQSEYRPTEYFREWNKFWHDEKKRLKAAKYFQLKRCDFILSSWPKIDSIKQKGIIPYTIIDTYRDKIKKASDNQSLMGTEANFAKQLYGELANAYKILNFSREPGKRDESDRANSYIDHGNYLAYGLGATVLWVLGIPFSMPVSHGMTRRGALVFDVADIIKDGCILPNAFQAASEKKSDQKMRDQCISFIADSKALPFLFNQVKEIIEIMKVSLF